MIQLIDEELLSASLIRQPGDKFLAFRLNLFALCNVDVGADEAELKAIEDGTRAEIQAAAAFAQESPEPNASELWTDVLLEA